MMKTIEHAERLDHKGGNAIGLRTDVGTGSARVDVAYPLTGGNRAMNARDTPEEVGCRHGPRHCTGDVPVASGSSPWQDYPSRSTIDRRTLSVGL